MKGYKTIAEYANTSKAKDEYVIKNWMRKKGFVMSEFTVTMNGNFGTITDRIGDSIVVKYDPKEETVSEVEDGNLK